MAKAKATAKTNKAKVKALTNKAKVKAVVNCPLRPDQGLTSLPG